MSTRRVFYFRHSLNLIKPHYRGTGRTGAAAGDLLERSIAGLPPQLGQSPLRGADEQTHREVEGLLVAEAASLFRNHPGFIVVVGFFFFSNKV